MMTIPLASHTTTVKRQLEAVLKDTKILCELEPFVKKWSIQEFLPTLQPAPTREENDISAILREAQQLYPSTDPKEREKLFHKVKEIMTSKSPPSPSNNAGAEGDLDLPLVLVPLSHQVSSAEETALGDQYDRELECTLTSLKEIENMDAVTATDIEHFKSGLGKPDGPDLHKTNIQEWKHIFLEHWLNLERYFGEIENKRMSMSKHKGLLPDIRPISSNSSKDSIIPPSSFKTSLHSHFMTRRSHKNLKSLEERSSSQPDLNLHCSCSKTENNAPVPPPTPPTPTTLERKSLLRLRSDDANKMTSSAKMMREGGVTKDHENHPNYYHQQRQRIRNCVINRNILHSDRDKVRTSNNSNCNSSTNKTTLLQKIKGKVGNPSIRPSSAIPSTSPYLSLPPKLNNMANNFNINK